MKEFIQEKNFSNVKNVVSDLLQVVTSEYTKEYTMESNHLNVKNVVNNLLHMVI